MSQDQLLALLRQVLPILGTLLTVFGLSSATATAITNTLMSIAGPLMMIASTIWSLFANSKKSILTSAANMPEVKTITIDTNVPGAAATLQATPDNVKPA